MPRSGAWRGKGFPPPESAGGPGWMPDIPAPAGYTLEQFYYPDAARIAAAARSLVR